MPWDGRRWGWHLRTRRGCGGIRLPVFPLPAAAATVATAAARSRALQFFYFIKVAKKFQICCCSVLANYIKLARL